MVRSLARVSHDFTTKIVNMSNANIYIVAGNIKIDKLSQYFVSALLITFSLHEILKYREIRSANNISVRRCLWQCATINFSDSRGSVG